MGNKRVHFSETKGNDYIYIYIYTYIYIYIDTHTYLYILGVSINGDPQNGWLIMENTT